MRTSDTQSSQTLIQRPVAFEGDDFEQVCAIYFEAFPPEELMPVQLVQQFAAKEGIDFMVYAAPETPERIVGFTYTLLPGPYAYILFLAVDANARGGGYGTRILDACKQRYAGRSLVLEIEPLDPGAPNLEQRTRRLAFYERNGFAPLGYDMVEEEMRYTMLGDENARAKSTAAEEAGTFRPVEAMGAAPEGTGASNLAAAKGSESPAPFDSQLFSDAVRDLIDNAYDFQVVPS